MVGYNVYKRESEPYAYKKLKQEVEQRSSEGFSASGTSQEGLREGMSLISAGEHLRTSQSIIQAFQSTVLSKIKIWGGCHDTNL